MQFARGMRQPTGIKGLDEITGGGFVPGSTIAVGGKAGTGKTLFCSQFLYAGIAQYNQPGVYVTMEERPEDIKSDIRDTFGWDLDSLEQQNLLVFIPFRIRRIVNPMQGGETVSTGFYGIMQAIIKAVDAIGAKRVVIDPVSMLEMMVEDKFLVRSELAVLLDELKERGVTTLLVTEVPETEFGLSRSEFVEFMVDTVVKLDYVFLAKEYQRTLTIKKMRRSKHSGFIHPFVIAPRGIEVLRV